MAALPSDGDDDTPAGAAKYIAALTHELAELAKRHGLNSLGYILEMARLEAEQVSKSSSRSN
jgi:hypothetical protein